MEEGRALIEEAVSWSAEALQVEEIARRPSDPDLGVPSPRL